MTRQATKLSDALTRATSRRGFFKCLGRIAAATAGGIAGILAARTTQAAQKTILCCHYITPETIGYWVCRHNKCPEKMGAGGPHGGDWLLGYYEVSDCSECGF